MLVQLSGAVTSALGATPGGGDDAQPAAVRGRDVPADGDHRDWLRRGDRVRLQVELTAFPIIDQEDRLLGAVAMFWER